MSEEEAPFPGMSPADVTELTDDQQDKQNALKQEGVDALDDGKDDVALEKFTAAIEVGCGSALLYSRRAQLLMKLGRPKAAANDCTAALATNPDSAKAYKMRARINVKLENWVEANLDFQTGLKIDYDEDTYEESLEAAKKAKEIQSDTVKARNKEEAAEYQKKMQENKEAYEAGLKANAAKWEEEAKAEKDAKDQKENERRERVRKREEDDKAKEAPEGDEPGVPKSHGPPDAAEDVD